ncbi:nicotinamide riboside transporter PnuC [Legionella londiniensis]|uniref:nicotinamide riboside transporter PnuC n=1 Tax=Legionella londiniensis TaxID=45068 RepID=UPI00399CD4F5
MIYDFLGALASFISTYYFIRQDKRAWLIGFIATSLNGWLYWQNGIYADMCLESFYALTTGYGWYQWSKNKSHQQKHYLITKPSPKQALIVLLAVGIIFLLIYYILCFFHSTIAALDALTSSLSLVAQWLMCHKIITTWILWFVTDALYALIYIQKNLPAHVILMLLYMFLAISGYKIWLKSTSKENSL